MQFQCPVCQSNVSNSQKDSSFSTFFPFCSQRCRLVDLGLWFDGQYRIPVNPQQTDEDAPQPSDEQNG
jgi:endogenous inhibitor of DNA gyrase (YacG/DUF329 family)